MTPAAVLRVVLADDAALFRDLLAAVLHDQAGAAVTVCGDTPELIRIVAASPPDIAIVDIRLPPTFTTEGLVAAAEIRRRFPAVGVLILSQHLEVQHLARLMQPAGVLAGGFGYLLKERVTGIPDFLESVKRIASGEIVVDATVVDQLLRHRRHEDAVARLSAREREVLGLIAEGLSNAAISARLGLSGKTLETHIGALFNRLDLPADVDGNRRVLAVLAFLRSR